MQDEVGYFSWSCTIITLMATSGRNGSVKVGMSQGPRRLAPGWGRRGSAGEGQDDADHRESHHYEVGAMRLTHKTLA